MDFNEVITQLRNGELNVSDWNFCICEYDKGFFAAYIMGEGAEQCLSSKRFGSRQEIVDLYTSLGVKHILPI